MQWTRTKQWAAIGLLVLAVATTVVTAGTAGARGDGRWPAGFPASVWTGATWQEATAITGMLIFGKMSVGVRRIMTGLANRISSAKTINVYGRFRATLTIHIMDLQE